MPHCQHTTWSALILVFYGSAINPEYSLFSLGFHTLKSSTGPRGHGPRQTRSRLLRQQSWKWLENEVATALGMLLLAGLRSVHGIFHHRAAGMVGFLNLWGRCQGVDSDADRVQSVSGGTILSALPHNTPRCPYVQHWRKRRSCLYVMRTSVNHLQPFYISDNQGDASWS